MTTLQILDRLQTMYVILMNSATESIDRSFELGGFNASLIQKCLALKHEGEYIGTKAAAEHVLCLINQIKEGLDEEAEAVTS